MTAEAPSVTLQDGDGQLQVGLQPAPDQFSLQNSAPNPASGPATIAFIVPEQTHVTIDVFDVLGRRVATLADGQREPGRHDVRLDVGSLSSGTYFYRMSAEGFSKTRRLEVVR
nr:T9SS type A sorting domain-containing protein [Salinibacter ruber]